MQEQRMAAPEPSVPRSEPMASEGYIKPHSIPDPRDSFSIPSNELRKEKKQELDKMDEDAEQDKADRELATIARGAKSIIDSNKRSLRETQKKYNKQERKDLLTRQETHKELRKLDKRDKMEKDLEEQMEVENTIKRAD